MAEQGRIFGRELFQFLAELKFNNERSWFEANRGRYEEHVKRPLEAFGKALAERLRRIDPAYDRPRVFRIHRDTRFSRDKAPYKTQAAIQFPHRAAGGDVHAPGFYVHLEPGESFVGGGIWAPDPEALRRIRAAIVARPARWAPLSKLSFWGESYARPPKGVDPGHRFVEDLKRKHFITWVDFDDRRVVGPAFLGLAEKACRKMAPLVGFLNGALGLE